MPYVAAEIAVLIFAQTKLYLWLVNTTLRIPRVSTGTNILDSDILDIGAHLRIL